MPSPLLHRCECCGVDPARIVEARAHVQAVVNYLRNDKRHEQERVIQPSLEYESGALDALNWVLGCDAYELFDKHLASLGLLRNDILAPR
jgi:hypothetical protein